MNPVHFSSKHMAWRTPRAFFEELDREFGFVLDAAADEDNALCEAYLDEEANALIRNWARIATDLGGAVWCNPPYGRGLGKWIDKASSEAAKGATVVLLIPARPDTHAWHTYILGKPGVEVRFVRGRLKFGGPEGEGDPAPFPSAVVIFRPPKES